MHLAIFLRSIEWKIFDCGNDGIIYGVKEEGSGAVWHIGPEVQVLDNKCHPDAKIDMHRADDLYDMIVCNEKTVKPACRSMESNSIDYQHWKNRTLVKW